MDLILGTAGHIDHGKTALVRALTGIDCDRLAEEKRRGITIELGFAWMDLPDGRRLGVVDVPGHERFVKNMVAGAAGVDVVLLVIAANEGVMPQTREHLEICSLLGVRSGLVALTKTDLVDDEWLEMAKEEVQNALADTFLAGCPIVPVSAATGAGIETLREQIIKCLNQAPVSPKPDIFRLPIDRVFNIKGFGAVVTGTIISGSCERGEKLAIYPSGKLARARGLQVHNSPAEKAWSGQRCAVNLQGLEIDDPRRGDVVGRSDTLFPSQRWLLRLHCLKSSPTPIRQRMEVHFHHGAKECLAKIVLLEKNSLEPGESAIAEARFGEPMTAVYGDRCVLRARSPLRVIGGGVVINPDQITPRKREANYGRKFELLRELGAPDPQNLALPARKAPEELVLLRLSLADAPGLDLAQLRAFTGLPDEILDKALETLEKKGQIYRWACAPNIRISEKLLKEYLEKCRRRARELHEREPLKTSFPLDSLASALNLPPKFTNEIIGLALKKGVLEKENEGFKLAARKVTFNKAEATIVQTLLAKIKAGGFSPPFIKELAEQNRWDIKKIQPILKRLLDTGQLVKIADGFYYEKEENEKLLAKIRDWFATNPELDLNAAKNLLNLSRKYLIPVLEYLDASRLTHRINNVRRLRQN